MKKLLTIIAAIALSLGAQAQDFSKQSFSVAGNFQAQKDTNILIGGQISYDIGGSSVFARFTVQTADNNLFAEGQANFVLKEIPEVLRLNVTASGGAALNQNGKNPGFFSIGAEAQVFLNGKWKSYVFVKDVFFTLNSNIVGGVGLSYVLK